MRRGVRLRVTLTHAAVAALAILVMALVVNVWGERRFTDFREQEQRVRAESVVRTLAGTYRAPEGWSASAIFALSRAAEVAGVDLAVYSLNGQLLFTVQGADASDTSTASPSASAGVRASDLDIESYPVLVGGDKVASVQVYARRGRLSAAATAYRDALQRDLAVAVAIAGVLALLASILIGRRITAPLEELSDAASEATAGNLDVRVAPRDNDEIGTIAEAFNEMADRLARDEQWRRDMTADLSQSLGAPLAAIQARIAALEDGSLELTSQNVRVAGREVERLGGLVAALHSLNELESEDVEVDRRRLDLRDVVRDSAARVEAACRAKGITLAVAADAAADGAETRPAVAAPLIVEVDRDRLLQAVGNLLDNALKFTPAGGSVAITAEPADGPAAGEASAGATGGRRHVVKPSWCRLVVADDGPGIDPVDLPLIFDRFYRSSSARGTRGVGLGLAVARGLVEAEGGAVEAANRLEGGAAFSVVLPLVTAP